MVSTANVFLFFYFILLNGLTANNMQHLIFLLSLIAFLTVAVYLIKTLFAKHLLYGNIQCRPPMLIPASYCNGLEMESKK